MVVLEKKIACIMLLFSIVLLTSFPVSAISEQQINRDIKVVVVLVEFTNLKHVATFETSDERIQWKVFDRMNNYFRNVSCGRISISGSANSKWYLLDGDINKYTYYDGMNREVNFTSFVEDVVKMADKDIDFRYYDNLIILHAGTSEQFGYNPFAMSYLDIRTEDGVVIKDVVVNSVSDSFIVIAHEFAHVLGHLPDLYDVDLAKEERYDEAINKYVGPWDLMSSRFNLWPSFLAWNLAKLKWLSPSNVVSVKKEEPFNAKLDPLYRITDNLKVINVSLSASVYYLVEVRQFVTAFDGFLPDRGVLITLVNESVPVNEGGVKVIISDAGQPTIDKATFDLRDGKMPVYLDKQNNLSIILRSQVDGSYIIEVADYGVGEDALVVFKSISALGKTLRQEFWVIDFLGSRRLLDNALSMYENGNQLGAKALIETARETNGNNSVITFTLASFILYFMRRFYSFFKGVLVLYAIL